MKTILIYAFWLTLIFIILRVVVNTITKKGNNEVLGDSCIVFVSCYLCEFLSKKLGFRGIEVEAARSTPVFTDNAGF